MKQLHWAALVAISIMIGMNISCKRELYDQEAYQEYLDSVSPVDTIDPNHTWILTNSKTLLVQAPDTGGTQIVKILTANPRESGDAQVVGEAWASEGERFAMALTYPSTMTTLYAAVVDTTGRYSIVKFSPESESLIYFDNLIVDHEKISYEPQPLLYTYGFEEDYPAAGDFDYNDVVLRISQSRSGEREMRVVVQMAAVGAAKQIAGAIRLVGIKYNDVENVTTVDSLSFNTTNGKDFPDQMKTVMAKEKTEFYESFVSNSKTSEAVLNLFGDAHWATGDLLEENFGMMKRKKYNVSTSVNDDYAQFVPRTITYIVTLKNSESLNEFSMEKMDPFILEQYNGSVFEVHQYAYRTAQILYPYSTSRIKGLPWALCMPMGDFRWPLEGVNIGFMKKGVKYGAYQTSGHSFGEWSMDRNRSLDWYEYPSESQVF